MVKGIVDVGSNSVLALVASNDSGTWMPILDRAWVTALGERTKTTGLLGEKGIDATLRAIREAYDEATRCGARTIVALATMAARMAKNSQDFLCRAHAQGTPVRILSGEAEARLGLTAVAEDPMFGESDLLTIIDVGGHSTELSTAKRGDGGWLPLYRRSFAIGTLGLRESILTEEAPGPDALLKACRAIDDAINLSYLPGSAGTAVSLGATGTNLVSIRDRLETWDPFRVHGASLEYEEVSRAVGLLVSLGDGGRASLRGIEPGRERTIHIGALILERFLYAIRVDLCRVSARGWRYGLLDHDVQPSDLVGV